MSDSQLSSAGLTGAKILIAEDDEFLANAYRVKFGKLGYQLELASDGQIALDKLSTFIPDLLLLDLVMPNVDGFKVLAEIKTNPKLPHPLIIVASNLGQPEDIAKAKELGATDYVVKSELSVEQIAAKVSQALTNRSQPSQ